MSLLYEECSVHSDQHKNDILRPVSTIYIGGEFLLLISDCLWNELLLSTGFPSLAPIGEDDKELPVVEIEVSKEVRVWCMLLLLT